MPISSMSICGRTWQAKGRCSALNCRTFSNWGFWGTFRCPFLRSEYAEENAPNCHFFGSLPCQIVVKIATMKHSKDWCFRTVRGSGCLDGVAGLVMYAPGRLSARGHHLFAPWHASRTGLTRLGLFAHRAESDGVRYGHTPWVCN